MTWIQTVTGRQFWPLNPRLQDVCLEDVAWSLSMLCRFNGHCKQFYSVADHSIRVAEEAVRRLDFGESLLCKRNVFRLGLLHDAAEAYLGDVARPIKSELVGFERFEMRILDCICSAVGVKRFPERWILVKKCDDVLLATEKRDLMVDPPADWAPLPEPLPEKIVPRRMERRVDLEWLRLFRAGVPS